MTNRQKILNMNPYDFLIRLNNNIFDDCCIIEVILDKPFCDRCITYNGLCTQCIAEWLNEESEEWER